MNLKNARILCGSIEDAEALSLLAMDNGVLWMSGADLKEHEISSLYCRGYDAFTIFENRLLRGYSNNNFNNEKRENFQKIYEISDGFFNINFEKYFEEINGRLPNLDGNILKTLL